MADSTFERPRCLVLLLSILVIGGCQGSTQSPVPPATLAITHVTLIDGVHDEAQTNMTVLVDGDRIVAVGPADELVAAEGTPQLNGEDRFLIPGLWDMHVHLAMGEPEIEPSRQLELYLAHGVVGVRDMGSEWQQIQTLRQRVADGEVRGPKIVSSGPFVNGPQAEQPEVLSVTDEAEARQAVQSLVAMGVDFVKAQAALSREAYLALVDEARLNDLPVHGHIPDALTALEVSAAGQRTIEHVSPAIASDAGMFFSTSANEQELRQELMDLAAARGRDDADPQALATRYRALQQSLVATYDEAKGSELFAALRANETWVVPTLVWSRAYVPPNDQWPTDLPLDLLPVASRQRWEGIYERYFAGANPEKLTGYQRLDDGSRSLVGALHRAGVGVLAGTDSPFGYVIPGFSLHQELEMLVLAGLSPGEALATATSSPAKLLGQLATRGTIEVGKVADLVLLTANPLEDIRNSRKIDSVVIAGTSLSRAELDGVLATSAP